MRTIQTSQNQGKITLLELFVVLVTLGILAVFILFFLARSIATSPTVTCLNNLRLVSLEFNIWASDHDGEFPMWVSTNHGGSMEHSATGQAFRHFQTITNQCAANNLFVCPSDQLRRNPTALSNSGFGNQNLSYFIGLDAYRSSEMLLAGDRNITGGILTNGNVMLFKPSDWARWTKEIHRSSGNIAMANGSADHINEERTPFLLPSATNKLIRLAIP